MKEVDNENTIRDNVNRIHTTQIDSDRQVYEYTNNK